MGRLAYYFSTFPALTTTFMQHQVAATETMGLDDLLVANTRPEPGTYHPQDEGFLRRTTYLTPIRPGRYLTANLAGLVRSPGRYLAALGLAFRLNDAFPRQRAANLAHLAGAAVLADHLRRHNAVHAHVNFAFGAAAVSIFLNRMSGIPYSLTIHGSDVILPRPLTEAKVGRAKFIVSNCHFHAANLRRRFPSLESQKFYIVRGGVDTRSGPWSRPSTPSGQGPLKILAVGRLMDVKAQDVLIKACAGLAERGVDFQCRIIGDGPLEAELRSLIESLGLTKRVSLDGALYQDEVIKAYHWSDVVVLSSKSEGTPMILIEAMALGRAVIAPRITALPEMIEDDLNGWLTKPGSADDLADRMARLAGQPELTARLGRAGRTRAEELYDLTGNAARLMAVFAGEIPELGLTPEAEVECV